MRWIGPLAVALLLSACSDEPDFDARYDKANADIAARIEALDAAARKADEDDEDVSPAAMKLSLPVGQAAARDGASSGE